MDAADWEHLTQWSAQVFPTEARQYQWVEPGFHILIHSQDGLALAHLAYDAFDFAIGSLTLPVIGIGGVVVHPSAQGQGLPAVMFETLHSEAPAQFDTELFSLFCPARLVSYYQRHGYRQHNGQVFFRQNGSSVASTFELMLRGASFTRQAIHIDSLPW